MDKAPNSPVDLATLREAIRGEYEAVACDPNRGYHFHTGRAHAERLGYRAEWLDGIPMGAVEFRQGFGEDLPVDDGWADVVISNGSLNLMPDKAAALAEMARVLKPQGRLQIADILVQKPVSEGAKKRIDLWTG